MRIEPRYVRGIQGPELLGLVLVAECREESKLIDECFGSKVGADGLIAKVTPEVEVRLSDGYGEHYIYVTKPNARYPDPTA